MLLRIWDILTGLKTDPLNTLIYGMGEFFVMHFACCHADLRD